MSTALERAASGLPPRAEVGQATAVEQSRAAAEVHAAVVVAQQCPRNLHASITSMRESCQQQRLAERAFYRYPKGGSTVTGESVHLARELARCWGNVDYGITELSRDDAAGISEMKAWAWDVQTNTRSSQTFIVPHKRDKRGGPETLTELRDIYENNANNGARRLRAAIFSILPPWFVEEAVELCNKTLADGGGKPLAQRIATVVAGFEDMGVTVDQLEQKLGRPAGKWTDHDVAQLIVTGKSIKRGEVSKDDEFPPPRVTVADITKPAAAPEPATATPGRDDSDADAATEPAPQVERMTERQKRALMATYRERGGDRLAHAREVLGRDIRSFTDLTREDAGRLLEALDALDVEPADDAEGGA